VNQSSRESGFQFTLNISQTPLHMNLAKMHWKKMCSTSSSTPQRAHFPSEGPPTHECDHWKAIDP
jgi:hypothetical protein